MRDAPRLLVAGLATRALVESAARSGYTVTAVDATGSLDLEAFAETIPLRRDRGRPFTPLAAANVAHVVPSEAVAYVANLENHPQAVARLADGRTLLGNPPAVLERVRDPLALFRALRRRGFSVPEARTTPPPPAASEHSWLLKPRQSSGGEGIVPWHKGQPVPRSAILEEQLRGVPGSIVFAADGRRAVSLGVVRQLVGASAFGVSGFRYCGSVLGSAQVPTFVRYEALVDAAVALADAVTEEFGLVGLNAVDFVARDGVPVPIEVNPRYSAAMELIERAHGVSIFDIHARACGGDLPRGALLERSSTVAYGKALVHARRPLSAGDTRRWLRDPAVRDVPHPRTQLERGQPICTVFAEGRDMTTCRRALARRAAAIMRDVETASIGEISVRLVARAAPAAPRTRRAR